MPTRFGKFVSGKHFWKFFLIFYVLFMCFAAYETNAAVCLLFNRGHCFGIPYMLFALISLPIIKKKKPNSERLGKIFKKPVCFLLCFLIYYSGILLLWELISLVLSVSTIVKAIGVLLVIGLCALIVLLGYMHTKNIHIKNMIFLWVVTVNIVLHLSAIFIWASL